ncbi:GNAT family N-acetyltransferase [Nocardioides sp. MAH-18]|uniref:GNAT family N-acetyltransferase n=1 Tax=Nocardioides agri TaxID=2682843 RepID=A0A6L6Y0B6_9ACTN|nr:MULTISPECIES: GNAT family N-acetyltransferase [unclassified Nocardioides]MBA2956170.1 GNAT family N-acetyltransferase [Nocardioides sp. CGMCC 1.13656]MVQ51015.1 GNAT family N-acetyltransferase [Nocardioides sp. MAH-18]
MSPETIPATGVQIRRATVEDAATVLTLLLELAAHEHTAHAVHATLDDWRCMLANPAVLVLLAVSDDQPVGYVSGIRQLNLWLGRDIFAMDDLYVRAEARDRGIGGRLMAALADHLTSQTDDRPLITWGVRDDNDAGHRFYERLGARLRTKVVAAWTPNAYGSYVSSRPPLDAKA